MIFRALVVLLFSIVFAGCASTTLAPETSAGIQQGKVASAAYTVDKKIVYEEMVYKVLYNETVTQQAMFENFWDIDKAHTDRLTSALKNLDLNATPTSKTLSEEAQLQLEQTIKHSLESAKQGEPGPFELEDTTRSSLRDAGYNYLVLLRTSNILVTTTSMIDSATIWLPSVLIVVDLEADREAYNELFLFQGFSDYEDSVRQLEENSLALIKEATQQRLEDGLEKRMADILSIETAL
ncbi:hypothetical protein JF541_16120 [Marinobacter hydrocarbonoclasticus]|uniref:hypothetical protein n=1 Tax=Marinobacter nauticus TaxID=2743 RepID=UPI001A8D5144|nr:hypothetical protein [Marinobacter nauticus]MBN8240687.1 hypothetical protein [Marinobacter nauticus]|tara:strand:+ start:1217 stop:1930 length:714 start_codon:yes stop_codon:yes gene_type:complete|mmetsp:Transcript_3610/g.5271  ORF Transcript_3610/g.5271 Transcript_3610/m.5271 type:complete len:238 (+) Transcript_3610:70-783(+)